jgi:hypothetical protein
MNQCIAAISVGEQLPEDGLVRQNHKKKAPWPLIRKQTIPTERPPLVSEVSANFCG